MWKRLEFEVFEARASEKHSNKYVYHKEDYIDTSHKARITCPDHGDFWQEVGSHLKGCGCPMCHKESRAKNVFGFGINDYDGPVCINRVRIKPYDVWMDMIKRVCTERGHRKNPAYIDCKICDEWRYFSNFKQWFDENYIEGNQLDKDLLSKGEKIYSPETCCFLPKIINCSIKDKARIREHKSKKGVHYSTRVTISGVRRFLGLFDNKSEAILAYRKTKEEAIRLLADEYYKEGKIALKAYLALKEYKSNLPLPSD